MRFILSVVVLGLLATPASATGLDAFLKLIFNGPGPSVEIGETDTPDRHGITWPRVIVYPYGDGICTETHYRDGTVTLACVAA